MSTINSSDIFLVNRSGTSYKVTAENLVAKLQAGDYTLINRGGSTYKAAGIDGIAGALGTDFMVVNRGGTAYKVSCSDVQAQWLFTPAPDPFAQYLQICLPLTTGFGYKNEVNTIRANEGVSLISNPYQFELAPGSNGYIDSRPGSAYDDCWIAGSNAGSSLQTTTNFEGFDNGIDWTIEFWFRMGTSALTQTFHPVWHQEGVAQGNDIIDRGLRVVLNAQDATDEMSVVLNNFTTGRTVNYPIDFAWNHIAITNYVATSQIYIAVDGTNRTSRVGYVTSDDVQQIPLGLMRTDQANIGQSAYMTDFRYYKGVRKYDINGFTVPGPSFV